MDSAAKSSEFDDVYPALGRLVVSSGYLEGQLRSFAHWLAVSDESWVIFAGQNVDWLIQTARAMLSELKYASEFSLQDIERFESALSKAKELSEDRNHLVHGHWRVANLLGDEFEPRPQNSPADERVFYVARSKLRKDDKVRQVAVVDIELLADRMFELGQEIQAATDEGQRLRHAWSIVERRPYPGYADWDVDAVMDALSRTIRRNHS